MIRFTKPLRGLVFGVAALAALGCKPPDAQEEAARKQPPKPTVDEQLESSDSDARSEGIRRAEEEWGVK